MLLPICAILSQGSSVTVHFHATLAGAIAMIPFDLGRAYPITLATPAIASESGAPEDFTCRKRSRRGTAERPRRASILSRGLSVQRR
jgi:hypothetical protein